MFFIYNRLPRRFINSFKRLFIQHKLTFSGQIYQGLFALMLLNVY